MSQVFVERFCRYYGAGVAAAAGVLLLGPRSGPEDGPRGGGLRGSGALAEEELLEAPLRGAGPATACARRLAQLLPAVAGADLGAEVIKVEPPRGEGLRHMPPQIDGMGSTFGGLNAGKDSLA